MFQRTQNQKKADNHLSEKDDESVRNYTGNEDALVNNLIMTESNEHNNALIDNLNQIDDSNNENGDRLAHYLENDLRRDILEPPNKRSKGKDNSKKAVPKEIADEGFDNYYLADLNRLDREQGKKKRKGNDLPLIKEKDDDSPLIPEDLKEIDTGPIKNDNLIGDAQSDGGNDDPLELMKPIIKEDPNALINNIVNENNMPEKQEEKAPDADKISAKSKSSFIGAEENIRNDDLDEAEKDMKPIDGWNFNPTKLPKRKTAKWYNKLATRIAYYTGKTLGKVGGFLFHLFTGGWKLRQRKAARNINLAAPQQTRDHELIPGWEGAKYEGTEQRNDEPDIDFRRVPAIWSYPIAAKAEKSPNKPADPVISIYVAQPRPGVDDLSVNGNTGHSGIGIEFSRKSNITGEWERYNLRFGFFTAGGIDPAAANSVMAYNRAMIPGQLMDERDRPYDVSRSYKVNNQQVSDVLKAAETYPDKGYNSLTRNCTTFAKEMIVRHAHIPAGDEIFKQEAVEYDTAKNFLIFGASSISMLGKAGMEQSLTKLTQGDDTSYAGYGNKRMTREEYDRYYNSISFFNGAPLKADTPNGAAENMRRLEGKGKGTIGSYKKINDGVLGPLSVRTNLDLAEITIKRILQQITPADQLEHDHYKNAVKWVSDMGKSLNRKDFYKFDDLNKQELRDLREKLTEDIDNLNTILFDYYKNDSNLHMPIMNAISLLTHAVNGIDADYEKIVSTTNKENDELNNLRVSFRNSKYDINFGDEFSIEMTPSLYEAYLQVYKTPEEFYQSILRRSQLEKIDEAVMRPEQKKELEKINRKEVLVREFEKSHRYMLEKQAYTQQDIDYAFGLEKKEASTGIGVQSEMYDEKKTASSTYKTLFLEKIFGGMKGRYRDFRNNPKEALSDGKTQTTEDWLNKEFLTCAKSKQDEIKMILNSIAKSSNKKWTKDDLALQFLFMLDDNWIKQLYGSADWNTEEYKDLHDAFKSIRSYSKFRKLLEELADDVLSDLNKLNAGPGSDLDDDDD